MSRLTPQRPSWLTFYGLWLVQSHMGVQVRKNVRRGTIGKFVSFYQNSEGIEEASSSNQQIFGPDLGTWPPLTLVKAGKKKNESFFFPSFMEGSGKGEGGWK